MKAQGYPNLTASKLYAADLIDYNTDVNATTFNCNGTDAAVGDRIGDLLPSGTATVKVEQVDLELKRITVTLSWTERGRSRSYVVASLVANI